MESLLHHTLTDDQNSNEQHQEHWPGSHKNSSQHEEQHQGQAKAIEEGNEKFHKCGSMGLMCYSTPNL